MTQLFSTHGVLLQGRLASFRAVAEAAFAPIEVECDKAPAPQFSATVARGQVGPVFGYAIEASAHSVRRLSQCRGQPRLVISVQDKGESRISQPDGEQLQSPVISPCSMLRRRISNTSTAP